MGPILGAEFIVAAGDLTVYADAAQATSTGPSETAAACERVFYMSAQTGIIGEGPNRGTA